MLVTSLLTTPRTVLNLLLLLFSKWRKILKKCFLFFNSLRIMNLDIPHLLRSLNTPIQVSPLGIFPFSPFNSIHIYREKNTFFSFKGNMKKNTLISFLSFDFYFHFRFYIFYFEFNVKNQSEPKLIVRETVKY